MQILVLGANGQLGSEFRDLSKESENEFIFWSREDLDLSNLKSIEEQLNSISFDVVINCSAYTAVDKAESDQESAFKVNGYAVGKLAQFCASNNKVLLHYSTDFVMDGNGNIPLEEEDLTNPVSVYGNSKLHGELLIQEFCSKFYIIRTAWVYSTYGSNFAKTMNKLISERESLGVVYDQIGTPTYAQDIAKTTMDIINHEKFYDAFGIYNFSNEGAASWYDFAKAIQLNKGYKCDLKPILTHEYPTPAKRPVYSVLNKAKIKDVFGVKVRYWKEALEDCLKSL